MEEGLGWSLPVWNLNQNWQQVLGIGEELGWIGKDWHLREMGTPSTHTPCAHTNTELPLGWHVLQKRRDREDFFKLFANVLRASNGHPHKPLAHP